MRVIAMIKASKDSEAGTMPSQALLEAMGRFNEELVAAGVMVAGEGLQSSSHGARIRFDGDRRIVEHGPFGLDGLVAGYWVWRVASLDDAIEWAARCPNPMGETGELELRPLFEMDDFGDELTPELREQERRLRAKVGN